MASSGALSSYVDSVKGSGGSGGDNPYSGAVLDFGRSVTSSASSFFSRNSTDGQSSGIGGGKLGSGLNGNLDNNDDSGSWFGGDSSKADPCLPSLSKRQRVMGFGIFLFLGAFCFIMCSLYLPFLVLKARKFALMYTLGSVFLLSSFSMLWGPWNHLKHLLSGPRLPFTGAYAVCMVATLYFSLISQSYILTLVSALCQVGALVWYIVSYIPGGQTGLKFFSKIFYSAATKTASTILPV